MSMGPDGHISEAQKTQNKIQNEEASRSAAALHATAMLHTNSQDVRNRQAALARDYGVGRLDKLRLSIRRNRREINGEIVWMTEDDIPLVQEQIRIEGVVQTLLSQRIAEYADGKDVAEFELLLPEIWSSLETEVSGGARATLETNKPGTELPLNPPARRDEIPVISPPVPMQTLQDAIEGTANESVLPMPDEGPSLAETLGAIAEANSD